MIYSIICQECPVDYAMKLASVCTSETYLKLEFETIAVDQGWLLNEALMISFLTNGVPVIVGGHHGGVVGVMGRSNVGMMVTDELVVQLLLGELLPKLRRGCSYDVSHECF